MRTVTPSAKRAANKAAAAAGDHRRMLKLAVALVAQYRAEYDAYREHARESTRGGYPHARIGYYREAFCEHGTSLWTDYDNICGGCEEGWTNSDPMQRMTRALGEAKERIKTADERLSAYVTVRTTLSQLDVPLTDEQRHALLDYATRPLDPARAV